LDGTLIQETKVARVSELHEWWERKWTEAAASAERKRALEHEAEIRSLEEALAGTTWRDGYASGKKMRMTSINELA
jgi:hypothetical protein